MVLETLCKTVVCKHSAFTNDCILFLISNWGSDCEGKIGK